MKARALPAMVIVALLAAGGSSAASTPLTNYPVPRGGFTVAIPSSWVDLTNVTPEPDKNGKTPTIAAIAKAASTDGAKKLVAADPKGQGTVYIDVEVERVGPVTASTAASETLKAIRKVTGKKGSVTSKPARLAGGEGYVLNFVYKQHESSEYLLIHDQIEYSILYVAPQASWAKYASTFEESAASFRFLAAPKLTAVVLSTSQLGAGYKSSLIPEGNSFIGEATLDLCAGTYPSESLRTGRLQLRYVHAGKAIRVSNEVVTYTKGGAQEALREVRGVAASCARKPVVLEQGQLKNVLSVVPIKDAKLLPGSVAVRITVKETNGSKHATTTGVAIYQVKNDTLSGVYAWTTPGTTIDQAAQVGLRAAEQSARNLGGIAFTA
ncbi:MAG TPA: hypothetical protein VGM80_12815 [Gaiellaceae bacterium]